MKLLTAPSLACPLGVWMPASPASLCLLSAALQLAAGTGPTESGEQSIALHVFMYRAYLEHPIKPTTLVMLLGTKTCHTQLSMDRVDPNPSLAP